MIIFVGDTHGSLLPFRKLQEFVTTEDVVIQVGDFWASKMILQTWNKKFSKFPCGVFYIDGNHEPFGQMAKWSKTEITEVAKGLHYIPRGTVHTFQGKTLAFLGGGESIDKASRTMGWDWWPEESINSHDVARLYKNVGDQKLDGFITHCPPTSVVKANYPPLLTKGWGLPDGWQDQSAAWVEESYRLLRPNLKPDSVCVYGHMHKSVTFHNFRGLAIGEAWSPRQWDEQMIVDCSNRLNGGIHLDQEVVNGVVIVPPMFDLLP